MNNCTIVLFGASGDLSRRKIIPALYHMVKRGTLKKFLFVGAARDQLSAEHLLQRSREFIPSIDESAWQELLGNTHFQVLDFTKSHDYVALATILEKLEKEHGMDGNRIIYQAAASSFFCDITANCAATGIAFKKDSKKNLWCRIIYEKPFGNDLASAQEINACIRQRFDESQIYRIDHFLTKELVGNISLVRFTNLMFEPLWNNRYIDQVQIILSESIGIEGRGAYYDEYGALRDVVQNHMLEMLALIAMEAPEKLSGNYIRDERAKVLAKVRFVDGLRGQFAGYTQEPHVQSQSSTETFAALALAVDNPRWAGVPFYLKTGKCLDKKETTIHIKFKKVDCLLTNNCPSESNVLTIEIAPKAGFVLRLNAKKVGEFDAVDQVKMEFCHSCLYLAFTPEDYEVLFKEIIKGEQSIAVRFDEIESAWKVIDAVIAKKLPVYQYEKGSQGPQEMKEFEKKYGMRWIS